MAKKICNICNIRPVDRNAAIADACVPCFEEGSWENQHQDDLHDDLSAVAEAAKTAGAVELRKLAPKAGVKNGGKHKSAELRALILKAIEDEQAGCWICHPELNEAQKVKKARAVSIGERISRKGQKINVPLKAPGETKALVVVRAAKVAEERVSLVLLSGAAVLLDIDLGHATLHLAWDAEGRYDYAEARFTKNGKISKVRNVAEALRLIEGK